MKLLSSCLADLRVGVCTRRLWLFMGWQDIKIRYRRSVLGPFWITISTGIFVFAIGPIYGGLFGHGSTFAYTLYLALGFVSWQFISGLILEGCQTFIGSEGMLKDLDLPISTYPMVVVWRQTINLIHNLVLVLLVLTLAAPDMKPALFTVPAAVLILAVNGFCWANTFGMLSARFRDIPQLVGSLLQMMFVLTPILWQPGSLRDNTWAYDYNPFFHLIEIARAPVFRGEIPVDSWLVSIFVTVPNIFLSLIIFVIYRRRLIYWL